MNSPLDNIMDCFRIIGNMMTSGKSISVPQQCVEEVINIAVRNKIALQVYDRWPWDRNRPYFWRRIRNLHERARLQLLALEEIAGVCQETSLDFMLIKTVKPFRYAADDIDVLVKRNEREDFVRALLGLGFHLSLEGTRETTLRRPVREMPFTIDVDVRDQITAGAYEYLAAARVWNRRRFVKLGRVDVSTCGAIDDILILAGHCLLKDFQMSLADFYQLLLLLPRVSHSELVRAASSEGLEFQLNTLLSAASAVNELIYGGPLQGKPSGGFIDKILRGSVDHRKEFPYPFPAPIVALSYLNAAKTVTRGSDLRRLSGLFALPGSKGIGSLLSYVRMLSSG